MGTQLHLTPKLLPEPHYPRDARLPPESPSPITQAPDKLGCHFQILHETIPNYRFAQALFSSFLKNRTLFEKKILAFYSLRTCCSGNFQIKVFKFFTFSYFTTERTHQLHKLQVPVLLKYLQNIIGGRDHQAGHTDVFQ